MTKYFLLFTTLCFLACTNSYTIKETTALKDLPDTFFKLGHTHQLSFQDDEYVAEYQRLPNTEFSKFYLKNHTETYSPFFNVTVHLNVEQKITFEGQDINSTELIPFLKDFSDFAANGKQTLVHLNFNEQINVKEYLNFLTLIKPLEGNSIQLNKTVFIYNPDSLPDCDCNL